MRHPLHAALLTGLLLTQVSGGALAQAQEQELSAGELRLTPETGLQAPGTPSTTAPTALPRAAALPPPVQTGLPPSVLAALQRAQVPPVQS